MLRVEHLQVGDLPPLSFEVAGGECLAIEGASGSGKSLLLRAIADLDSAPGKVVTDGIERGEVPAPAWRKRVRYCAAEPQWWSDTPRGSIPAGYAARVENLLAALRLTEEMLDRPVSQLSTGERQRLALVRAMIDDPQVLLLDEPTGALDPASTALVEKLIESQLVAGKVVLLVSHDAHQVDRLANARIALGDAEAGARVLRR